MVLEKRRNRRFNIIEQVSIRFDNDRFLNGTECSDISLGGMCVVLDDTISTNEKYGIIMMVQKYNDEVIVFESKFVRLWDNLVYTNRRDTRMGIKFIDIDPQNFDSLLRIIELQSKDQHV